MIDKVLDIRIRQILSKGVNEIADTLTEESVINYLKNLNSVLLKGTETNELDELIIFLNKIFSRLNITIDRSSPTFGSIPNKGGFVLISNHPYGTLDILLLLATICPSRPDFKVLGRSELKTISVLSNFIITPEELLESANEQLAIGIFATTKKQDLWKESREYKINEVILAHILKQKTELIQTSIEVTNMLRFYLESTSLGKVHQTLIESEWIQREPKMIQVRVCKSMSVDRQKEFHSIKSLLHFLEMKQSLIAKEKTTRQMTDSLFTNENERIGVSKETLHQEISRLPNSSILLKVRQYTVYCAPSMLIPMVLNEIGRLRESAFRDVVENNVYTLGLDKFDLHYDHLFIWDSNKELVVGAYRLGKGKEILDQYGVKGFSLNNHYKLKRSFLGRLYQSVELGCSFIRKEYQKQPLPLFLLWKGILVYLIQNPDYRYLIGEISISGKYRSESKELLIRFLQKYHFDKEAAKLITSRSPYQYILKNQVWATLLSEIKSIDELEDLITDLEPCFLKLPIILKKYLSLNSKTMAFYVDEAQNNRIDALILLDLRELPIRNIEALSKELNDNSIISRFTNT